MPRKIESRQCEICAATYKPHHLTSRYCSKSCAWRGTKGPDYNAQISRATAAKRGDAQRGRGDGKTYRKRNGLHEHRLIAEQKIGRALRKGEIVHHKDGNHLNNDPENLQVMTQAEHMREHGLGIPGKPLSHQPWRFRHVV